MAYDVIERPSTAQVGRPSWLWWASALVAAAVALAGAVGAWATQRAADRPIGEGEVFIADAAVAVSLLEAGQGAGTDPAETVRHIRNTLEVEAAALVAADGIIDAATSDSLLGAALDNGFLAFSFAEGRFGAVAVPVSEPVAIDGVEEWPAGSVLYAVIQPVEDGALLLHYSVSELLGRRVRAGGITDETLQLAGISAFFVMAAGVAVIGRARVVARHRELQVEAEFLRRHSEDLEAANLELEVARAKAEEALALAEEKNRVRAEFVLMINHELRTPLTGVVTGAGLLQSGSVTDEVDRRRIVDDMVADGTRLQEMIGQMLTVARIENRGLNFDLQEITVGQLRQVVEAHHPRLVADGTDQEMRDRMLRADPMTLPQVIGSLVDNAYNHGAAMVRLECTDSLPFVPMIVVGKMPDPAIHFIVRDDGPGIDPEFLPRAFEKFEKDSRSSGTGLGLYLTAVMVEAMGGAVTLTTSQEGTAVAVSLPALSAPRLAKTG